MIAAAAKKLEPARVDPVSFREHIVNALLIAATFGTILVSLSMATIAFELNLIRISEHQAVVDFEHAITSRVDTLLWKTDTFLTTFKETNKNLTHGLTDVRVQVKQAQDVQTTTTKELSRVATRAVKESLKATSEVVQAVVDKPPTQVEVTGASPVVKVDGHTARPGYQPRRHQNGVRSRLEIAAGAVGNFPVLRQSKHDFREV
jgi:hypothetical protein